MSSRRDQAAARLAEALASRRVRCSVIGLGFIGSTLMDALIAAGFEAHGYDRDPAAALRFRERGEGPAKCATRPWSAGEDPSVLSDAECVFVAVRTPLRPDGTVDLEPLESAAKLLRDHRREERLVLVECTLPPGTTRSFGEEWIGGGEETGIFVAHSPERLSVGHDWKTFKEIPHLVGGLDSTSTRLAGQLLSRLCDTVVPVSAPEISELSKLLENAFLSVGVGLAGEITRIAHELGISAAEVCEAAASKSFGYHAFHPGPGLGGHCLPNDLRMLAETGRRAGGGAPLVEATAEITSRMPGLVVDHLERLLAREALKLHGARVLLVGVGFKIDCADTAATPARDVVRTLRDRRAQPAFLDSRVTELEVDGTPVERVDADALAQGSFAAGLVLAGDPGIDGGRLRAAVRVLLDAGGGVVLPGGLPGAERL